MLKKLFIAKFSSPKKVIIFILVFSPFFPSQVGAEIKVSQIDFKFVLKAKLVLLNACWNIQLVVAQIFFLLDLLLL